MTIPWAGDLNANLPVGTGFLYRNTTGSSVTTTFIGEVVQGYSLNTLSSGLTLVGSKFARSGVVSDLILPISTGDVVSRMTGNNVWTDYNYRNGIWFKWSSGAWVLEQPSIAVGEGFFVKKSGSWRQNTAIWP